MTKKRGGQMTYCKRKANARTLPPVATVQNRPIKAGFWKKKTG
jgi:hypothetical protein